VLSRNAVKIWKPVIHRSITSGDRLLADGIDVIDHCSVSVYSEGTRVPKQIVRDFDVHEPFLNVKKWNGDLRACGAKASRL
jgi:hypothetical protein